MRVYTCAAAHSGIRQQENPGTADVILLGEEGPEAHKIIKNHKGAESPREAKLGIKLGFYKPQNISR